MDLSSSSLTPRRPVLSSLLLASLLFSVSATDPSPPSQTPSAPSFTPHAPSHFTYGTIPIQLPFVDELEWPTQAEEDEARAPSSTRDQNPPPHLRLRPTSSRKRQRSLWVRQEDESAATSATEIVAPTAVATVGETVVASRSDDPLAVASATKSNLSSTSAIATSSSSLPATTSKGKVAAPVPTPALPVPNPFPQPFDLTLNLNLSSPCLDYFAYFLSSPEFKACRPFSLLASSSSAFSTLASADNLTSITAVVQATLNTSSTCESIMVGMGTSFADRCKSDIANGVPIAKEALTGFQTYAMMKEASALVSSTSGAYCYIEALTSNSASDLYAWNLYTGASLPNSTIPSCSSCTKNLFAIYGASASNASLALSVSYPDAVVLTNTQCGTSYAATVLVASSASPPASLSPLLTLGIAATSFLIFSLHSS